ncbi:UNVERIFIED_CONTAM: hypothetical protein PYX00_010216 [Menopon gallinae]|uniref:Uncharacterized protein n=1 Tax=Menopon gallinae TaxID=328185 RepID=A0AAW2HEX7_9NEOP
MKCSFKTVHINALLIAIVTTLFGRGSPVEEEGSAGNGLLEGRSVFLNPEQNPEKYTEMNEDEPEEVLKYARASLDGEDLAGHGPKTHAKRNRVNIGNNEKNLKDKNKFLLYDTDRGKRSEEKRENLTAASTEESLSTRDLPDFEKCYNDEKKEINLDGYPCKQYRRYPDKFDRRCYYECGVQPDGNMKIERRCCSKGEEFSPRFLECVASEYLKLSARRKRYPNVKKSSKQRPTPEPEYNYDDDKEQPNEWLDAPRPNKLPSEFKSKSNTLRIFHLQCKRNLSDSENNVQSKKVRSVPARKEQHHNVRSFIVRPDKKDAAEEEEGIDDDEEEEYEYEDDDYDDALEDKVNQNRWEEIYPTASPKANNSASSPIVTNGTGDKTSTPPSKILLDADIRVDREFEKALKNILGKKDSRNRDEQKGGNPKDSILIRLSGEKFSDRIKRNFLRGMFSKKPKSDEDPDKEGIVSMRTLINGLPSEYERDALLQNLERRKMVNSNMDRSQPQTMKRRRKSDLRRTIANRSESDVKNGIT